MSIFKIAGRIVLRFPKFLKDWLEKAVFLLPQTKLPEQHTGTHVGIVVGGGTGRIEKAIEAYKQGLVDYFLVSGGIGPYSINRSEAEAETFANLLIAAGVPDNHIWIENQSVNTVENVKNSMEILIKKAEKFNYGFIYPIIFTNGFHLKRVYSLFESYLSRVRHSSVNGINIAHSSWVACPFPCCELTTWRNSEEGCARVAKEAFRLFAYRLTGKI